jgi:hypothetical protein
MPVSVKKKGSSPDAPVVKPQAQGKAEIKTVDTNEVEHTNAEVVDLPTEIVSTGLADGPVCEVEIGLGYTKNMGNFNSARFDVKLRVPCLHTEVDAVADFATNWVDDRIKSMIE